MGKRLSWVHILVGILAALAAGSAMALELEAEDAITSGLEARDHTLASGGQRMVFFNAEGKYLEYANVPEANFLEIRYSNGETTTTQCSLYIAGADVETLTFPPTGGWTTYDTLLVQRRIHGDVRLQMDADDAAANGDDSGPSQDKIGVYQTRPQPVGTWRSILYPHEWEPGTKDALGRFVHDFSYAGYHRGEKAIPDNPPGATYNVTQSPYNADNTGAADATDAIQAAIDAAEAAGGGIVYLPAGTYRVGPPDGEDAALRIEGDGVVIRGAGPTQTYVFNDDPVMRSKKIFYFRPGWGSWFSVKSGSEVLITQDILEPTHTIPVADASSFSVGDRVILNAGCTDEFIAEHNMTGDWSSGLQGITFAREVTAVDTNAKTITIDIPTRYYMKTRDGARVFKTAIPMMQEVGVEDLSFGMQENTTGGTGDLDYAVEGTTAYEVHACNAIQFVHVLNGWVRNVHTYKPSGNSGDYHMVSNGILLYRSQNCTVADCVVEKPQYEGGGGNGYGYIAVGGDCLFVDNTANHTRHNFDLKSMWTSGNVFFRCTGSNPRLSSDFHMHLSAGNLFDSMTMQNDWLQAVYRPYGTAPTLHGHPTTESVFWNTYAQGNKAQAVESRQWGWGYVVGTKGTVTDIKLGTANGTDPEDLAEGAGKGDTLYPQSLYLDQWRRRMATSALPEAQTMTIETDGHFWAMAYNFTTNNMDATKDSTIAAAIDLTVPVGRWIGVYVYDYSSASWSRAAYVLKERY